MQTPPEPPETPPRERRRGAVRRPRDPEAPAIPGAVRALRLSVLFESEQDRSALGLPVPCVAFLGGFLAFCAVFATRMVPTAAYVAVHETTHALFGLAFGARVSKLRIGPEGGSVDVSRRNAAILLAPYFCPLPLLAVLAARGAVSVFVPLGGTVAGTVFSAVAGAAWGFHFCFTVNALLQYQTDLDAYGFFFSTVLLALLNLAVLGVTLTLLGAGDFSRAVRTATSSLAETYLWTVDRLRPGG